MITPESRARALNAAAAVVEKEAEALARLASEETRLPLKETRRQAARAAEALRACALEARRLGESAIAEPADGEGSWTLVRRAPKLALGIAASREAPLSGTAEAIAAASAAGTPFTLTPDSRAPKTAARLVEILVAAGWPAESGRILPSAAASGASAPVAAAFIGADADLPWAAARGAWAAYSGVCPATRRFLVESSALSEFRKLLVQNVRELKSGDPLDPATDVGPMSNEAAAARAEAWVKEAVAGGAKLWAGGARAGAALPPTVLEKSPAVPRELSDAPIATLEPVDSRERALDALAGGGPAGLFTNDLAFARRAFDRLTGDAAVNDVPQSRFDARRAIEDCTTLRTLVVKS